jgi:PIN domain nuclease of toxin-antitoxin system
MRLLLDTHALIWWLIDSPRLSQAARAAIADPRNAIFASAAGRLAGPHRDPWDRLIIAQAIAGGFTVVSVDAVFRDYGVPVCW